MLPPRLIRRLVLAPLVIVIAVAFVVLSPFLALLALVFGLLAQPRAGQMRSLRLVGFALVWLVAETVALFMLAGLWVASGFGGRLRTVPYQSRHYAVMRWFLDMMYRGAERTYGLRVEVDEPELTGDELAARLARPVIVLSRHAGPGDSFLLVRQLLSVYQRRPRVVMKAALQLDPSVDIVGNRLPNVWIKSRQTGERNFTEQIERLARGLDERGALVIFPEGGNWTPGRWRRGIRRLEHLGRPDLAERAREMPNLLPPRPGGALAAITACPDADVIFVAHAGLDNIVTMGDVWGKFPVDQVIRARWWRVPRDSVPRSVDHETQVQWLYGWWERIDTWITENRPGGVPVVYGDATEQSGLCRLYGCTLLSQKSPVMGSTMGYSGQTGPMPALTCLPEDWWDPAWHAVKSPDIIVPAPGICDPGEAAQTTEPDTHPAEFAPPPSWGQVLATTFSLWTSRHLPWVRRFSRRLLAASALGAGLVAVLVGTTGLAAASLSSAPPLPARPAPIPAPSGRTLLPASQATAQQAARPVWLSIPSIGVRTSLIDLGVNKDGTLQVPGSTAVAGWFTGSPRPGMVGSGIIAGHVDSRSGPGIFFWLRTLHPGDRVYVGRADGTLAVFTVTSVQKFAKDQFPTDAVYGPVPDPELRLITCGGVFDRSLGRYVSNVVVFARLTG